MPLMTGRPNDEKEGITESQTEAHHENKVVTSGPRERPSLTAREIILGVAWVLMSVGFSYLSNRPRIVYLGALGLCVLIMYAAHSYVRSQERTSKTVEKGDQPSQVGPGPGTRRVGEAGPVERSDFTTSKTKPTPRSLVSEAKDKASEAPPTRGGSSLTEQPRFHEKIENYVFSLGGGGIHIRVKAAQLESGRAVEPFDMGGFKPVRLYVENGKWYADFTIYDGPGLPPVQIRKNEFVVRPVNWDRNSSENALEVVNEKGFPVFQLVYQTPSHIVVNGVFPTPAGLILANDDGTRIINGPFTVSFGLKRIFRYPSWKYPGQFEDGSAAPTLPQD